MTTETKTNQTKQNGAKPKQPKQNDLLSYEIPMPVTEALECLTRWQKEVRKNQNVTAVGFRVNAGMLMVEVVPEQ